VQRLTVMMAQLNLLVGDIEGNAEKVLTAAQQAVEAGAQVLAFPELTLTAYPPEDLLLRDSMGLRIEKALQRIREQALDIYLIVGHPLREGGRHFNAASVIFRGRQLAVYRKQRLPNYEVFDEQRYFQPGTSPCVVEMHGVPVALTICEDLWDSVPTEQASQAGARLLININASPYHQGKSAQRHELLRQRASASQLPIVYVNLVGGQDELVFDGQSMAVDATGACCVQCPAYEEILQTVHFELHDDAVVVLRPATGSVVQSPLPDLDPAASLYGALQLGLRDYVKKNDFPGVLLGLSGGIDSALTLAIAVDALGAERVTAVMMPFAYTSNLSLELAESQATRLGVNYRVLPISAPYEAFMAVLAEEFAGLPVDLTEQNIQARCRGVLLMAMSNKKGALVITTGNKSETAVGYSTLYGDMAGGFNALKDAYKTQVYALARWRNDRALAAGEAEVIPQGVIERPPSAELAPGQRDEDSLPPYDRLDAILLRYIEQDRSAAAIIAEGYDRDEVYRVVALVDRNEYKRRQGPVGVRLTQKGFGRDRRYPITNGWRPGE